jgi:hypothetical protein
LNDLYSDIPSGKVTVTLVAGERQMELLTWEFQKAGQNQNISGPTVRVILPQWDADQFDVLLEVEGHPEYSSSYTLVYRPLIKRGIINNTRRLNQ